MPNTREKLVELMEQKYYCSIEELADHLIANGVTVPGRTGDCYWATEQAYKNGYEQGMKDALCAITRCKDCTHSDTLQCSVGYVWCARMCRYMKEDGFCSFGERKTK